MMQNADITLTDVRVPDSARLKQVNTFADVAGMLRAMRSDVAWIATGVAAGAYEAAVRYTSTRAQFGRPIGGFQLVQEKLARMLANVTAALGVVVRLAQLQEQGIYRDEDSALAKMLTSADMRDTVALAREVCGGNGITLQDGCRPLPRRRGSGLLLRGHPRDQRPHRRSSHHRARRIHLRAVRHRRPVHRCVAGYHGDPARRRLHPGPADHPVPQQRRPDLPGRDLPDGRRLISAVAVLTIREGRHNDLAAVHN